MTDIKKYEKLAGLNEKKKLDQKVLLDLKKKLLTIIKKKGLMQASEFIKKAGKEHGDEYIDDLIAFTVQAEAIVDSSLDSLLTE